MPRQLEFDRKNEYAIDTSALVRLEERRDAKIWPKFFALISEHRVKTVTFVMDELVRTSATTVTRLKAYRNDFVYRDMGDLVSEASRLINLYPKMSRPRSRRTVADPWVIALAQVEGMTVVTCELSNPAIHIPDVCKREGVDCRDLDFFITTEKLA
jgi:predicted nucleic acid-binding protein